MTDLGLSPDSSVPLLFIVGGDMKVGERVGYHNCSDLKKLLRGRVPHHQLLVTRNFFRQPRRADLSQYACIVNLIAEPERNEKLFETLRKVLRGAPGRVLNAPDAVLASTRDQMARTLGGIDGLAVPRVVRLPAGKGDRMAMIERAGLGHSVILRRAGSHGGRIVGLFRDADALAAALEGDEDYLATEYVDFRSADGLYRKYRIFFIGGRAILRHRLVSDEWNVHAKDRARFMASRPELVAEERALFEPGGERLPDQVGEILRQLRARIALDFFGFDFGIAADGRVVLFEANAKMCFFPFADDPQFDYLKRALAPAQRAFRRLVGLPEEAAARAPGIRWVGEPAQ